MNSPTPSRAIRFGLFEADLRSRELRKAGVKIHLQEQPFAVLTLLLENPGQIVTREELRSRLWRDEFVDFEHGLARAVNKLREALGDCAENPRFIETLPKRGYRLIAPVQTPPPQQEMPERRARSLAILPLFNSGGAPEMEYLCDGISEALIYSAAQLTGLRVMALSTVLRYKGLAADPHTMGRELQVDAIFMGRVRQRGDTIALTVELIDVEDGALLWGSQYNRSFADILALQEEIAAEIFSSLRVKLTRDEMDRVTRRQTSNPEAYSHYLQGRYYWNRRNVGGFQKAIEHFEQAIDRDPTYALGHAGIADYYLLLSIFPYAFVPPSEAMPRARQAALRALEIDSGLAEAYNTLGMINFYFDWNYAEAEKNFQIAIDLKPGYCTVHQWYSLFLLAMSRFEQGASEARKALDIDPHSGIGSSLSAVSFYFSRQNERAMQELRNAVVIEPNGFIAHLFLGYTLCVAGQFEAAIDSFQTACKLSGDNLTALARLGYAHGCAGNYEQARQVLQRLEEERTRRFVPAHHFTFVHLGLGDEDCVFESLERAVRERSDYLVYLDVDPPFDPLRADTRFIDLLRRVNLAHNTYSGVRYSACARASGST